MKSNIVVKTNGIIINWNIEENENMNMILMWN
jgi:hypothetical protein